MEHTTMNLLRTALVSSALLALTGCIVPDPFYGGPAYYSDSPRYYGAPPYAGGVYIDGFDEHRGEGRGRYEGREH